MWRRRPCLDATGPPPQRRATPDHLPGLPPHVQDGHTCGDLRRPAAHGSRAWIDALRPYLPDRGLVETTKYHIACPHGIVRSCDVHLHRRWQATSAPPPLWGRGQVGGDLRVLPPSSPSPLGGRNLLTCKSIEVLGNGPATPPRSWPVRENGNRSLEQFAFRPGSRPAPYQKCLEASSGSMNDGRSTVALRNR